MTHASEQQGQLVGLLLNDFEESASDWLWETDKQGRLRHVSIRFAQILGQSTQTLLGSWLKNYVAEPESQVLADFFKSDQAFRDVVLPAKLSGQSYWWSLTAKPLRDDRGEIVAWRGVGSDVMQLRQRELELVRLASVDTLTGLANRRHFNQVLDDLFAKSEADISCTLFIFDLDNFKAVNDSLGHSAGDVLLQELATRLQSVTPSESLLAPLGGDEFALILPQRMPRAAALALGECMQAVLNQACFVQGHRIEAQASFGISCAPFDANSAQDLVKRADMALYAAKSAGRRTLRFFEIAMDLQAKDRLLLLSDLREGLSCGQFELHYQPQIDWRQSVLIGFEALVRWRHPTRGMISPLEFIPLAEESGLIVALGQWVQHQACRDATAWPETLSVAVNVSAIEFQRSDVLSSISQALQSSELSATRLEIELTESTLLQNSAATLEVLAKLRATGVRVALDDFGTGFSSLSYLRSFPLDKLKIDRSFVQMLDADDDKKSAFAIVQAIHTLSQALGLKTIAEGMKTENQLEILKTLGCDFCQGYFYAKPLDAQATLAYIRLYQSGAPLQGLSTQPAPVTGRDSLLERPSADVWQDARRITAARPGRTSLKIEPKHLETSTA